MVDEQTAIAGRDAEEHIAGTHRDLLALLCALAVTLQPLQSLGLDDLLAIGHAQPGTTHQYISILLKAGTQHATLLLHALLSGCASAFHILAILNDALAMVRPSLQKQDMGFGVSKLVVVKELPNDSASQLTEEASHATESLTGH